jgi:predicted ATP-dependent endonuclease of OLD family
MRLIKAHVKNYRSVDDSGIFTVEQNKTILVGANEAGKTAILQAIQHLSRPEEVPRLIPLRDFPRSKYHLIRTGEIRPEQELVVRGWFKLDDADKAEMPQGYEEALYVRTRYADDHEVHALEGVPERKTKADISKDVARLLAHLRRNVSEESVKQSAGTAAEAIEGFYNGLKERHFLTTDDASRFIKLLDAALPHIDESAANEEQRFDRLKLACDVSRLYDVALHTASARLPKFVLFNNYFRVRPRIQLDHLAKRVENDLLDDDSYDYGNLCLLKLLGFTPRELSDAVAEPSPPVNNGTALAEYQAKRDDRQYQLNAASLRLTEEIRAIWAPDESRGEASKVKITSDGQYLKLIVEDSVGVEVELDQRSEGFQWLVSFFVVFFAEAGQKHKNAILLLDEPGVSLHGLKQREFRQTLSKLALKNQTIYTTHSPFLVGPDELDLVRVVEMQDRSVGTKVSMSVSASDSPALLPLQEALGYDMAQSLFSQHRNLVLEGLTDFWYIEAVNQLFMEHGSKGLEKVALIPAGNAGRVVYFATILHANRLRVAALLDSDAAGDQAATQDTLVHSLGQKGVIRTKDFIDDPPKNCEVEDLLRETLVDVAATELGLDASTAAATATKRPIVDIFKAESTAFSKYTLAKAFVRWSRDHKLSDLKDKEVAAFTKLFAHVNKILK